MKKNRIMVLLFILCLLLVGCNSEDKTIDQMKDILFNPNSLQVNKVIIYRPEDRTGEMSGWTSVYMDYSAMNKTGGYARDYAYATFSNEELNEGSFYTNFESNYRSAEQDLDQESTYYFDIELLDKDTD